MTARTINEYEDMHEEVDAGRIASGDRIFIRVVGPGQVASCTLVGPINKS